MIIEELEEVKREVLKLKEELKRLKEERRNARIEELRQTAWPNPLRTSFTQHTSVDIVGRLPDYTRKLKQQSDNCTSSLTR